MGNIIADRALQQLTPHLAPEDLSWVRQLIGYFDKNSLWLSKIDSTTTPIVLYFANEAERFRLDLEQLRKLSQQLRSGQRIDWDSLPRER